MERAFSVSLAVLVCAIFFAGQPNIVAAQTATITCPNITRSLWRGLHGEDVRRLQQFFISQNLLASDSATGFFGPLTERAVKEWQTRNNIVSSGSPTTTGHGLVGPRTRASLLQCMTAPGGDSASRPTPTNPLPGSGSTSTNPLPGSGPTPTPTPTSTPPRACSPEQSQTRAVSCPAGQVGSITQTRTSSCPGPVWTEWTTSSSACRTPVPMPISGALDPVDWMTTNKGSGHVRSFYELWDAGKRTWVSGTDGVGQLFKMYADRAKSQIYWRKDMPADTQRTDGKDYEFAGEVYTFSPDEIRLRFESFYFFPCPSLGRCDPAGQPWDIRSDKFRLFVEGAGALDTTEGLFFMPRPVWNGWSHGPYPLTTYYCNSYTEFHQSACSAYQKDEQWEWVTVEAYTDYDIFNADGDRVIATPDGVPEQRIYDVLIVSQEQQVTNFSESVSSGTARGVARERFFYGKIGDDRYGIVRWDSALNVNGRYVLDARAIGYKWDTSYNPQFSELQARGAENR